MFPTPQSSSAADSQGSAGGDGKKGEWVCAVCGNVNYPYRTKCHMSVCGAPRGFPGPFRTPISAFSAPGTAPLAWTCPVCRNFNRATRDQCHRTGCPVTRTIQDGKVMFSTPQMTPNQSMHSSSAGASVTGGSKGSNSHGYAAGKSGSMGRSQSLHGGSAGRNDGSAGAAGDDQQFYFNEPTNPFDPSHPPPAQQHTQSNNRPQAQGHQRQHQVRQPAQPPPPSYSNTPAAYPMHVQQPPMQQQGAPASFSFTVMPPHNAGPQLVAVPYHLQAQHPYGAAPGTMNPQQPVLVAAPGWYPSGPQPGQPAYQVAPQPIVYLDPHFTQTGPQSTSRSDFTTTANISGHGSSTGSVGMDQQPQSGFSGQENRVAVVPAQGVAYLAASGSAPGPIGPAGLSGAGVPGGGGAAAVQAGSHFNSPFHHFQISMNTPPGSTTAAPSS